MMTNERANPAHFSFADWPRRLLNDNLGRLALITTLVFVGMSAAEPDLFLTRVNLSSMAFQFPEFALLALGVMVSMLTGGIDLSVVGLANLSSMLAVLVFVAAAAGVAFVLDKTSFGLRVYLFGTNPIASRFAGVDNFRVTLGAYMISGLLASLAGLIIAVRANSAKADYGASYVLLSILIAVLGGTDPYGGFGKVSGLVLAVLALQFLSSGLNMLQISNFAVEMTWGALLLIVMVINTGGLNRLFGDCFARRIERSKE